MNILEKALKFATSKEILIDTSWSVRYIENLLGLENNDYFQENGKEFIFFYGYVNLNDKKVWAHGRMDRFIKKTEPVKEISFNIFFDDFITDINLDWLYRTSNLSFEEPYIRSFPFGRLPVSNFIMENYIAKVTIITYRDKPASVVGFKSILTEII